MDEEETFEGYLVDIACLRKHAQADVLVRASQHTLDCALMGHCVESGYGVVDDDGVPRLLEPDATPKVLHILSTTRALRGIRLRVRRVQQEGQMRTDRIDEMVPV